VLKQVSERNVPLLVLSECKPHTHLGYLIKVYQMFEKVEEINFYFLYFTTIKVALFV